MDDSARLVLQIVLSSGFGVAAALITTNYKFRKERQVERDKEKENLRLKFLNPLLVASEDLLDRLMDIKRRRDDPGKSGEMQRWFRAVADKRAHDSRARASWANDEGYFAVSTLYITAVYFYYAGRIRRDFPFVELGSGGETALLSHLSDVRIAIGGKFGIWEALQDSLGAYMETQGGGVKNYRQMCELLIADAEAVWFGRLMDFYRDIHLKLDDQLDNVEHALKALIRFLKAKLEIAASRYRLTQAGLAELRKHAVPPELVADLAPLSGDAEFRDEVDFVAAVVACVGQDCADDYKPSILKCAEKQQVRIA
ncbi:MAG TPA: hypothetical protein PL143_14195 [Rhodocyclaceae bacterium]|nr:hypothetical protein [Rhodocyclaceae bacterium]